MFKKYPSIENSYRNEFVKRIKEQGFEHLEYIVQEKVHGSNFSLWTNDGVKFKAYKRTGAIELNEKFYNYEVVVNDILPKLKSLWNTLKISHLEMKELVVFGELMGGSYPHKEVKNIKDATKVQKGIFYCPQNSFYAFDIVINKNIYLSVDETEKLFEKEKFIYAKTLFKGSLDECMKYPNNFQSQIYKQFDLPQIDDNVCEGVVIRPQETCFLGNGSRVILKNKNKKWTEKQQVSKKDRKKEDFSDEVKYLQEKIMEYVTENRMANVVSKVGEVKQQDIGKVLSLFNKDILEDFLKDYGKDFDQLEAKDQKHVTRITSKLAVTMLKKYIS